MASLGACDRPLLMAVVETGGWWTFGDRGREWGRRLPSHTRRFEEAVPQKSRCFRNGEKS